MDGMERVRGDHVRNGGHMVLRCFFFFFFFQAEDGIRDSDM